MMNNSICCISLTEWNHFIFKANIHRQSNYYKQIICISSDFEQYYKIPQNTPISTQHILAIMMYCNKDRLQREFTKTFRKMSLDETMQSMIDRHSNYHHWSKLLRECVECFGSNKINTFKKMSLYHGISIQSQFSSLDICMHGPVSSSTDSSVAVHFASMGNDDKQGMVLEFSLSDDWIIKNNASICLFQCKYLSDFSNEEEIFFIGGFANFQFESIIKTPIGINYKYYVLALIAISDFCNGNIRYLVSDHKETDHKQLIFRILSHQLYIHYPNNKKYHKFESIQSKPYIEGMMKRHFQSIQNLSIFGLIKNNKKMFKLLDKNIDNAQYLDMFIIHQRIEKIFRGYFVNQETGWIELDILIKVFPNLNEIIFIDKFQDNLFFNNPIIYDSLLEILRRYNHENAEIALSKISIGIPRKSTVKHAAESIIEKYESEFKELGWMLYIDKQNIIENVMYFVMESIMHSTKQFHH